MGRIKLDWNVVLCDSQVEQDFLLPKYGQKNIESHPIFQ